MSKYHILPVLPLRNTVIFPYLAMPIVVVRASSIAAVESALSNEDKFIFVTGQKDSTAETVEQADLYQVGTKALIKRINRSMAPHRLDLVVHGFERAELLELTREKPFLEGKTRTLPLPIDWPIEENDELEALRQAVLEKAEQIQQLVKTEPPLSIQGLLKSVQDPLQQVFLLAMLLNLDVKKEQSLLEANTQKEAMELMYNYLAQEDQILRLHQNISNRVASEIGKEQKEYLLRQQLRAIREELGEASPAQADITLLKDKITNLDLTKKEKKEAEKQLQRLELISTASPEYPIIHAHLDLVLDLPWNRSTTDHLDLPHAREIMDKDHFDLDKIKDRIIEHLAVLKLNPQAKAPILCFIGPPGVGKTSLGQSIARALGRAFERMSLGGLHDEAELRGHRRTYVGALPGRIIQAILRAGSNNPFLMLDEVDKLGRDFRGDPTAALMEILDPAQNFSFRDNYLELPFDLSNVFFVTTANNLDRIPAPLLDRMEVIRLAGYTEEEKLEIAKRFLLPRQIKQAGLRTDQLDVPDQTILHIIHRYTREAGLRQLERSLGKIARKIAVRVAEDPHLSAKIEIKDLDPLMGAEKFFLEEARKTLPVGVSTALAWTETGGEILYIEARLLSRGKGLTITGNIGDIMRESAETALSYVWSELFAKAGVHIHIPSGAIPKDGPSAGIAMAAALTSLCTDLKLRSDTAMTGEITLTGLVLPVGGLKEKVLAARRANIHRIILPLANKKDLLEIPENVKKETEFVFVSEAVQALKEVIPHLDDAAKTPTCPVFLQSSAGIH